jgi:hypothetical protein
MTAMTLSVGVLLILYCLGGTSCELREWDGDGDIALNDTRDLSQDLDH